MNFKYLKLSIMAIFGVILFLIGLSIFLFGCYLVFWKDEKINDIFAMFIVSSVLCTLGIEMVRNVIDYIKFKKRIKRYNIDI